jgi:hypothetical protein
MHMDQHFLSRNFALSNVLEALTTCTFLLDFAGDNLYSAEWDEIVNTLNWRGYERRYWNGIDGAWKTLFGSSSDVWTFGGVLPFNKEALGILEILGPLIRRH